MTSKVKQAPIVPREKLDFGLDQPVPKYWLGGDPFKTRFCDAMSTIFPEGERFFISCVRDYRDQVTDPQLLQEIKDFIRQEGQHGIIHNQFNEHLKSQGIDVDWLEGLTRGFLFGIMRKYMPKAHTLSATAACEHLTAIMAETLFERKDIMGDADPRMFALYAWHAMEEMEHKAVAFDVMQKVAKVGYLRRIWTQIEVTLSFNLQILLFAGYMLKHDGFSFWQRTKLFAKGLWWVYGPKGLFSSSWRSYLRYYRPGFHPWQDGGTASYPVWLDAMNRTRDPIAAGQAVLAVAH
ncbi:metal-dependent hydrolase [Aquabacterium sp.]|uniref:metal-dependent hydrolase n=1 Tax=Aquabacterium sp. TaxID=1872578 RepID=UPI002E33586D|nr:metal-dependent hydrolase [Aquabacterium sp.]HEX5311003.1 metal-dependent hydrolase [Aquabacterium sp.]